MAGRKPVAEGGKRTPWTLNDPVVQAQVDEALRKGVEITTISKLLGLSKEALSTYKARNKAFGLALLETVVARTEAIGAHEDW